MKFPVNTLVVVVCLTSPIEGRNLFKCSHLIGLGHLITVFCAHSLFLMQVYFTFNYVICLTVLPDSFDDRTVSM